MIRSSIKSFTDKLPQKTKFPQPFLKFPLILLVIKLLSSICTLIIPLALEWLYSEITTDNVLVTLSLFVGLVGTLYGLEILGERQMIRHKLKVKKTLSLRILNKLVGKKKDYPIINILTGQLPIYLNNYYSSYISAVFQLMKFGFIVYYLWDKLGQILLIGVVMGLITMRVTFALSQTIQKYNESNLVVREQKLSIMKGFFQRLIDYKMAWLDKWIHNKIDSLQHTYIYNLTKGKLLDCWCVGLWQFCSVGISAIVLSIYYAFADEQQIKNKLHAPTIIYYFNLLNFPLNALSWSFAGLANSKRIINKINDVLLSADINEDNTASISYTDGKFINHANISIPTIDGNVTIPPFEIGKGIYCVKGKHASLIMDYFVSNSPECSLVQQNAWQLPNIYQTIQLTSSNIQKSRHQQMLSALTSAYCDDIPLNNSPTTFSGGQKLRVSLARAFYHGKLIIIDSELLSLDSNLRKKVYNSIQYNTLFRNITTIIRGTQQGVNGAFNADSNVISFTQLEFNLHHNQWVPNNDLPSNIIDIKQPIHTDSPLPKKQQISLSTYLLYYKSPTHILFLISIIMSSLLKHLYNYYINITSIDTQQKSQQFTNVMIWYLFVFAIVLVLRSYLFARANLNQAQRIGSKIISTAIMSKIDFYAEEGDNRQSQSTTKQTPSRLKHSITSQLQTISSYFPFETNILANNIFEVLASLIIMIYSTPLLSIFTVVLLILVKRLDNSFRINNETLRRQQKNVEVVIIQIVGHLENGRKILKSYNKIDQFSQEFIIKNQQSIDLEWQTINLKTKVNLLYRFSIVGFMAAGIYLYVSYSYNSDNKGLSVLVNYALVLANYLLYLTISIAQVQSQAISIERIRQLLTSTTQQIRIQQFEKKLIKIRNSIQKHPQYTQGDKLLQLRDLSFNYDGVTNVLNHINLNVIYGDKVKLFGRSGAGKTTLFKILTGLHSIQNSQSLSIHPFTNISFSPQHPLLLPSINDLDQNLDPYQITKYLHQKQRKMFEDLKSKIFYGLTSECDKLTYQQQLLINNYRAYLYGFKGLVIYDEPDQVFEIDPIKSPSTYIVVSHHKNFTNSYTFQLKQGTLVQV